MIVVKTEGKKDQLTTIGLNLNKLPNQMAWITVLIKPLVDGIITRLDTTLGAYKKELKEKKGDKAYLEKLVFHRVKVMELREILTSFNYNKIMKPITNPHVAFNLFIIIQNQFELFNYMLHESGNLDKPLFGDLFRAWYTSLLTFAAKEIPEAKGHLETFKKLAKAEESQQTKQGDKNETTT